MPGVVVHTFKPRSQQAEVCKFEASHGYIVRLLSQKKGQWMHSISVCNPSAPTGRQEVEPGDSLKLMGQVARHTQH